MPKRLQSAIGLMLAIIAAASMCFYILDILRARQIAESREKRIPRGNLSDLYPRWLGARELLLHGRNPYSTEVTLEIQEGYYGRRLDPRRPNDPKDEQGFAYPIYVVFLLAPLLGVPFAKLLIGFYALLAALTAASVLLWLRVLRWKLQILSLLIFLALTLGSFAVVQGIKLQQLSLLVAALIAGSVACIVADHLFFGGILLAMATVKPQLACAVVAWLCLWTLGDWRRRRWFIFGFVGAMAALFAGGDIVLPGWIGMFAQAVGRYHRYTQNQSVVEVMLNQILGTANSTVARVGGQLLVAAAAIACSLAIWRFRNVAADHSYFSSATALVLALTVLGVPMYAPYNQVLLLPAVFFLLRERRDFATSPGRRLAYAVAGLMVVWQWMASCVLAGVYFLLSPQKAMARWTWPLFTTLALPAGIFALMFWVFADHTRRRKMAVGTQAEELEGV